MTIGQSYLVFASEWAFDGIDGCRLAINSAGNSETMEQAGEALSIARKLSKRTRLAVPRRHH